MIVSKHVMNRVSLVLGIVLPFAVIGPMIDVVNPRGFEMETALLATGMWLIYFWTRPIKPARKDRATTPAQIPPTPPDSN